MKRLLIALLIILLIPFNVQAYTDSNNTKAEIQNEKEIQSLYNYLTNVKTKYELLQDINPKEYVKNYIKTGRGKLSVKDVRKIVTTYVFKEIIASLKIMVMLIVICIISALLKNLESAFNNDNLTNIAYFACYSLIIIIIAKNFKIGIDIVTGTIKNMIDFMTALVPGLMVLLASVGGVVEAAVMDPIIISIINIFAQIFLKFIIPIILMSFVLKFVNSISEDYKISNLTKLSNQIALWTQGILMTIFIGIVTIRGITSKTIDAVTAKTAKYAVDNFVPVVGKCLSDAIATVAGYSLLLKNALSSLGVIVILAIIIVPIIKVLVIAFMYKLTSALVEPITDKKIVDCLNGTGDSLILLMSTLICVSVMFFILISIIAAAGSGVLGG
ncbi:stage III sporulation protein AE [Haloimpatiens sp. FM7330]|uniref:stage III sporulation protein AE n=1 Tax=Haloimpatiens sp. FM7330 TaxID=3298610 RepID=UPI00362989FA